MKPLDQYSDVIPTADLPSLEVQLRKLQANILQGFAKDDAQYGLLSFNGGDPKPALRSLQEHITSAWVQLHPREQQPQVMMTIGLSASGFQRIGLPSSLFWNSFRDGFAKLISKITGQDPQGWEAPFSPQNRIDGLVTIAGDSVADIEGLKRMVSQRLNGVATINWLKGYVKRNGHFAVENFGFADGISQPIFWEKNLPGGSNASGVLPNAPPRLALGRDPWPSALSDDFGSYLVFLKLEQDVQGFEQKAAALAHALNGGLTPTHSEVERAKTLTIGRQVSGEPLSNHPVNDFNDFGFAHDPKGLQCPLGSHIRKMNPRILSERFRRIVRRSRLYKEDEHKVGVLFQSLQYDLTSQFEHLFSQWGNTVDAPEQDGGVDPLLGQAQVSPGSSQRWPVGGSSMQQVPFDIRSLVSIRGGEYFYLPSIRFFGPLL